LQGKKGDIIDPEEVEVAAGAEAEDQEAGQERETSIAKEGADREVLDLIEEGREALRNHHPIQGKDRYLMINHWEEQKEIQTHPIRKMKI